MIDDRRRHAVVLTQGRPRPVHRPYLVRRRPTSLVLPGKDPPTGALLIAKVLHEICTRCGGDFTDPRLEKAACLRTSARRRGHWSSGHAVACLTGSTKTLPYSCCGHRKPSLASAMPVADSTALDWYGPNFRAAKSQPVFSRVFQADMQAAGPGEESRHLLLAASSTKAINATCAE